MDEQGIKKHIAKGELLPLYFFIGEEKLLLKKYLQRFLKVAVPENFTDFNFNEFRSDASVDEIADAALALPFMAEHKCVLVSDYVLDEKSAQDRDKFEELLTILPDTTVLVFYYPTANVKSFSKYKKIDTLIKERGVVVDFKRKEGTELIKYICSTAEKNGARIQKNNAQKLIEFVGNDLTTINNEILKLSMYAKDREINLDDMELLVSKSVEATVFELSKCILSSNFAKSYEILDKLFYMGEKAVPILAVLSSSFIDVYRVKCALEAGKTVTSPAEYADYKGKDFRLKYAQRDGRNLSTAVVGKYLKLLIQSDLELKSSRLDDKIVLETLIAKLLYLTKV